MHAVCGIGIMVKCVYGICGNGSQLVTLCLRVAVVTQRNVVETNCNIAVCLYDSRGPASYPCEAPNGGNLLT